MGRNFRHFDMFNFCMKTNLKLSLLLVIASSLLVGYATPHHGMTAYEYRVVRGVTDRGGLPDFEQQLNAAGKEGFTIHSTTLIPEAEGRREQALIILERPAR